MASAHLTRLITNARNRLPGATDDLVRYELFTVLDDFFQGSSVWKEEIEFDVGPGNTQYDVVPTQGMIVRLLELKNSNDVPVSGTMAEPGVVVLPVEPAQVDTYSANVILTVTDPVTSSGNPDVPDWILTRYHTGLLDGVLARMMSQLGKPWTSSTLALMHLRLFRQTVNQARTDALHKNLHASQAWRFPGFA